LRRLLSKKDFEKLVADANVVIFDGGKIVELNDRVRRKRYIINKIEEDYVDIDEV